MHTTRSATKQGVPLISLDLELKRAVRRRRRQHKNRMNGGEEERNPPPRNKHLNKEKMGRMGKEL